MAPEPRLSTIGLWRRFWLPHELVAAWLSLIAVETWRHAATSVQSPWGDAISYLQKAVSFWSAVHAGGWFNPFNLEPTIRPPGTVLMSYPFGLSDDVHGFYFRSVALPIACTVVAVYVAAGREVRRSPWTVAAMALLFASLPMFYWFDWNGARWINNGFGMVDNFEAGVAALAAAAMARTLIDKSIAWQCVCAMLFCCTFTIKQSGLMLMGLMGLVSLCVLLFEARRLRRVGASTGALTRYAIASSAVVVVIFSAFIAAAFFSAYLSTDNFNWAVRALGFYRSVTASASPLVFHLSIGEALPAWIALTALLYVFSRTVRRDEPVAAVLAVGSIVVWVLGLWYWFVPQGGGTQVRYFYPFVLVGLIIAVPFAGMVWSRAPRALRAVGFALCALPAVNIGALLLTGDQPSGLWQYYTGVSVSVGEGREEVIAARDFLEQVRRSGNDEEVYFFPRAVSGHYFVNAGVYAKIMAPRLPSFSPRDPMDWSRGFAVRTKELVGSRYVLTRKVTTSDAMAAIASKSMDTFETEVAAFDAWISMRDESDGLKVVVDSGPLRLLEVKDAARFGRSIDAFVAAHAWRAEFKAANRPGEPEWWSEQGFADSKRMPITADVRFAENFVVHAVVVTRTDATLKVEAWWEPLKATGDAAPRYLFLHLVDDAGKLVQNLQLPLRRQSPPAPDRPWRYEVATFDNVPRGSTMTSLGFGIYQPSAADGGLLAADHGRRDWDGKRVLVPLP